jgi:DNA invertase Pin-like site-specific DNA recombinase
MKPRRIVLCARVSTKDKGQDTENQLAQLREFAAKQDWTIVHEYVDHVSGKTAEKRPQFQAMLAAASRREFDLVLFWSLDASAAKASCPR